MATCESCNKTIHGTVETSITRRELCSTCHARLLGQTAGAVAGGPSTTGSIVTAMATAGWMERIKAWRASKKGSG